MSIVLIRSKAVSELKLFVLIEHRSGKVAFDVIEQE